MGTDLTKVSSGQPFRMKAATFNSFVDAARDYQERANNTASAQRVADTKSGIVFVRNDSGSDQDQFAVLGLDDLVIKKEDNESEFRSKVVFSGKTPDEKKHRGKFDILKEPLKAGAVGKGYVDDVTPVMLNVPDEQEECRFAAIEDSQTGYLKAAMYGSATILWREGGTGTQWAVVRIGKLPILFPVKLEQYSGEQGDDENPATWTYNVIDLCTGEVIEESVDPTADPHKWQRPSVGWMIEATFGYAHYNGDGDLVLGWINEMVDQEPCEDSESSGSEY
jgi:hypothetical protein